MAESILHIGPSFLAQQVLPTELVEFSSLLDDDGAIFLLNLWLSKCKHNDIPNRIDLDPLSFHKLLPQIVIEDYDPISQESILRLCGEFYRDIYPTKSWALNEPYYKLMDQDEIVSDWSKSDYAVYQNHSPTIHFFDLRGSGRAHVLLGELCLPVFNKNKQVQGLGYSWKRRA